MTLDEITEMALTIAVAPSQGKLDRLRAAVESYAATREREAVERETTSLRRELDDFKTGKRYCGGPQMSEGSPIVSLRGLWATLREMYKVPDDVKCWGPVEEHEKAILAAQRAAYEAAARECKQVVDRYTKAADACHGVQDFNGEIVRRTLASGAGEVLALLYALAGKAAT
jgi:hypothetical protein